MLNRAVLAGFMLTMIADWNQDSFPPPMKYFMFASRLCRVQPAGHMHNPLILNK